MIISPAKSLDFDNKATTSSHTQPVFGAVQRLNKKLKTFSRGKLGELMKISPTLSDLNYQGNHSWQPPFDLDNAKQAIYTFTESIQRNRYQLSTRRKTSLASGLFKNHIRIVWASKTLRFDSTLSLRNGNTPKSGKKR